MEPQEENKGLELALNEHMDKCSGEFVTIQKNLLQSMTQFDSEVCKIHFINQLFISVIFISCFMFNFLLVYILNQLKFLAFLFNFLLV